MTHITKEDIRDNFYYFKSIILYTVLLAIVYGYLTFILCKKNSSNESLKWILGFVVALVILLIGALIEFLYIHHKAKQKSNSIVESTFTNENK